MAGKLRARRRSPCKEETRLTGLLPARDISESLEDRRPARRTLPLQLHDDVLDGGLPGGLHDRCWLALQLNVSAGLAKRDVQLDDDLGLLTVGHVRHPLDSCLSNVCGLDLRPWGWLSANPASLATPPRVPKPQLEVPDVEAVLELISQAATHDPDLATLLRLAAVTGARRGQLCALRWSDIDLVEGTVVIARAIVGRSNDHILERQTKTGNRRRISIDPDTVDVLARHLDRCEQRLTETGTSMARDSFVFSPTLDHSKPWRPDGVSLAIRRLKQRIGSDPSNLLSLRHFVATQMLGAGVDVRTVAGRLGHSQASTTLNRYASWLAAKDQEAASTIATLLEPSTTLPPRTRHKP